MITLKLFAFKEETLKYLKNIANETSESFFN